MNASSIVTLVLLGAVFYLFLIAPQRRRAKAQQDMLGQLRPGAQVVTTAGMFATVVQIGEDDVQLEVAPGVVSRFARGAIGRVISDGEADESDGEAGEEPIEDPDASIVGEDDSAEPGPGTASGEGPGTPRES